MTAGSDLAANLEVCRRLALQAAQAGARLLVLPECFAFLGEHERDKAAVAEALDAPAPGPILATLIEMARAHSLWIVGGGMPERVDGDSERTYNTLVVVTPDGKLAARYRKLHLFDVNIPGKATLRESDSTAGGDEIVAVETEVGVLGLSICYDVRFPELYRELALGRGAELLLVPAAFTAHTGAAHWHTLLRARAIENQCFVIAAAQVGRHNAKRESYGHALIYDPWGELLGERAEGTGIVTADIDLARVTQVRERMPCATHVKNPTLTVRVGVGARCGAGVPARGVGPGLRRLDLLLHLGRILVDTDADVGALGQLRRGQVLLLGGASIDRRVERTHEAGDAVRARLAHRDDRDQ